MRASGDQGVKASSGKNLPAKDPGGEARAEADWLNRFFRSYYAHRPVNATFVGIHDLDHQLPDFSENGAGDAVAEMEDLLRTSEAFRTLAAPGGEASTARRSPESKWEDLDLRLAEGFLGIQLWEYQSDHFHRGNPSLYTGEAAFGLMSLFLTDFAPMAERMEAAAERMAAVPTLLAQGRKNVQQAPLAWTERAIRECRGALAFLTDGVEQILAESSAGPPGPTGPPGPLQPGAIGAFRRAAREAAAGFREYLHYLESELREHSSDRVSCGEEALSLYLRKGHFLEQDADEILAYAESEMLEATARVSEHPDFSLDALHGLSDLHPTVDSYYSTYQEMWNEVRKRAEEESLLTWPEFPMRYVPRPAWAREAAPYLYFLFYRSPAAFRRPPIHDYLVTPIDSSMPRDRQEELLRANNDSVIKLNHVIHHGSIGHHVQNWHAFRSRSQVGRMAAVDCASRIAMFCGGTMAEGWACYATDLMAETGALTPLETFAEMKGRTRMCARTIVDLRLHLGRMTLEEGANFYQEQAGMGRDAAMGEAVKNSMFPGAAVIYLLGTDAIHELRREISSRKGADFSLREFHDEFLSFGSIPVSMIAEEMSTRAAGRVNHAD